MGRREEDEGKARIPITIEARIAIDGDFQISDLDVFAVHGGEERVTDVPAGASFEIHAHYNLKNFNPGITYWTTCMTVWNATENKVSYPPPGYDTFGYHRGGEINGRDSVNCIMPDAPTHYIVTIFASQYANAGAPPESEW